MEIGPIPGIRAIPAVKAPPVEAELTARFEIEAIARAGDDQYTGNGKKAAGAEEDEEEELEEEPEAQAEGQRSGGDSGPSISYFA